jgi:hypothetical protein
MYLHFTIDYSGHRLACAVGLSFTSAWSTGARAKNLEGMHVCISRNTGPPTVAHNMTCGGLWPDAQSYSNILNSEAARKGCTKASIVWGCDGDAHVGGRGKPRVNATAGNRLVQWAAGADIALSPKKI